MSLTGSRIFGLQKLGRGHAKLICFFLFTDLSRNLVALSATIWRSESHRVVISRSLVSRPTFMITDHHQKPDTFRSVLPCPGPLPCPAYSTGSLHVSIPSHDHNLHLIIRSALGPSIPNTPRLGGESYLQNSKPFLFLVVMLSSACP